MTTRREFVCGMVSAGAAAGLPFGALADETPRLRFGVVSDIHIGGNPKSPQYLESALKWLRAEHVDAVLCPGDIAHSGLIGEMERFAETWHSVFPGGRGADGGRVELMISTGNHDIDAWNGRWAKYSEEKMSERRFCYRDNPAKTWDRLFGQKWELVWRREVKGYTFVGSQWSSLRPPVEEEIPRIASALDGSKPFFYCQHAHPKGTCYGPDMAEQGLTDGGESARVLSPYPNAVAFTGHSHCPLTDERSVWQGAFTSIGAGCLHGAGLDFRYDNATAAWHPSYRSRIMRRLEPDAPFGGGVELVEAYCDRLVVHRRSPQFGVDLGPAWVVPLPAKEGGPFDFARQTKRRKAPQFAGGARIAVERCAGGHTEEGVSFAGRPCVSVTFPRARTVDGCRVYDYVVTAKAEGMPSVEKRILAAGFAMPGERADLPGVCLFTEDELPPGRAVYVSVVPRDCFGLAGRRLDSHFTG